jgi:hypothetical protein
MKPHSTRGPRAARNIAEQFREEFGRDAVSRVGLRVEEARQGGNSDEIALWNEVARLLTAGPAFWWLMQRVEFYRHQASEAERKAAVATSYQLRQDLADVAMRWRELALQADLLAKRAETASPK